MESERPSAVGPGPAEERVGPYRILSELGRGGQCVVFLAEDARLGRKVALKVLPRGLDPGGTELRRFRREAEVAARLDHPGICPVLDAGESGGTSWIAMRFVEGETLARRIASAASSGKPPGGREEIDRWLLLFERVARALHAAHEAGLVHRDVKPGNIMITPSGEPVLLDFGVLPGDAGDRESLTRTGAVLGTPAYLAPECLRTDRGASDRRTDVWSLGVTAFEAFCLAMPFRAPTLDGLYHRILLSEPEDAGRLNPALPRDLRTVLATALEKDPARRYQTALDLAEEWGRVRRLEAVLARPAGQLTRTLRWAERRPGLAASLAGTFLALAAGLGTSLHFLAGRGHALETAGKALQQKDDALGHAESARAKTAAALADTKEALRRNRALALAAASTACQPEDPVRAVLLAREGWRTADLPETQRRLRDAVRASRERAVLAGHGRRVLCVAWSPSGDRVATGGEDNLARIWDAAGREIAVLRGHRGDVHAVSWAGDGASLVTLSRDGTERRWGADGTPGEVVKREPERAGAPAGRDGLRAVAANGTSVEAGEDQAAHVRHADGSAGPILRGHASPLTAIAFDAAGERLLTASRDGTIRVWDRSGRERGVFVGHRAAVTAAAFSPDGRLLASASDDGTARVWDVAEPEFLDLRDPAGNVAWAWFVPGAQVATLAGSPQPVLRIWDAWGQPRRETRLGEGWILRWISPEADRLLVGRSDRYTMRLLGSDGSEIRVTRGFHEGVYPTGPAGPILLPDGAGLDALFPADGAVRRIHEHSTLIRAAAATPDLRRIAIVGDDGSVVVRDGEGGPVRTLAEPGTGKPTTIFLRATLSADGSRLLSELPGGEVRLWDAADGRLLAVMKLKGGRMRSHSFHPSDASLAILQWGDGTAELRREGSEVVATLGSSEGPRCRNPVFVPDGTAILAGYDDGAVRLHGLDGAERASFVDLGGSAASVACDAPGGRFLAIAGGECRVRPLLPLDLEALAALRVTRGFTLKELRTYEELLGDAHRPALAGAILADRLHRGTPDRTEVRERIENDAGLDASVREAALREADRIVPDPNRLNDAAWEVVVIPGRPAAHVAAALRWARMASEMEPDSGPILNTLGVTLYRAGKHEEAIETLLRSDARVREGAAVGSPADSLFLAMSLHKAGRVADAKGWLEKGRSQMEDPRNAELQFHAVLREAVRVIEGQAAASALDR